MPSLKASLTLGAAGLASLCFQTAHAAIAPFSPEQQKPLIPNDKLPNAQETLLEASGIASASSPFDLQIPSVHPPTSSWLGWGANVFNNRRSATDATLSASNIASLTKTCSIPYPVSGQSAPPLVTGGVAYYPTWDGRLVALDYATCQEIWSTNISRLVDDFRPGPVDGLRIKVSRTSPVLDGSGEVLFIGTLAHALVMAIDRRLGKLIDTLQLDAHPFAIVTQSPTFFDGKLLIGVSSSESAVAPGQPCCTFVGSFHALSLRNGRLAKIWSRHTISQDDRHLIANANFSGAAVWGSSPSIDAARGQVFLGTGQLYSIPPEFAECQKQTANISVIQQGLTAHDPCLPRTVYQDSILALDLETGHVNWAKQLGPLDAWNTGCVDIPGVPSNPDACPETPGIDADFGMAPTFVPGGSGTPRGEDVIVVGQKNAMLYALSAASGLVHWAIPTGPGGVEGGLTWGVAVDDGSVYFTNTNSEHKLYPIPGRESVRSSVFGAVELKSGRIRWLTPAPRNHDSYVPPSVVNDVVLVGTTGARGEGLDPEAPGYLTPLDKKTGKVLRQIKLDGVFRGGAVAVKEYVLFGTGYGSAFHGARPGSFNVWRVKTGAVAAGESEVEGMEEL